MNKAVYFFGTIGITCTIIVLCMLIHSSFHEEEQWYETEWDNYPKESIHNGTLLIYWNVETITEEHNICFIFNDSSNWTNNTPMNITTGQINHTHFESNCSDNWFNDTPMNVTPSLPNYFYIISNGNHSEVYFVESCHTG